MNKHGWHVHTYINTYVLAPKIIQNCFHLYVKFFICNIAKLQNHKHYMLNALLPIKNKFKKFDNEVISRLSHQTIHSVNVVVVLYQTINQDCCNSECNKVKNG